MSNETTGEEGDEEFAHSVRKETDRLLNEYRACSLGEDADPEAYVERVQYLFEELRLAPRQDPVALAAISAFLETIDEDSPPRG